MNCPVCGSENTSCANYADKNYCIDCKVKWTSWQQAENENLKRRLEKAIETITKLNKDILLADQVIVASHEILTAMHAVIRGTGSMEEFSRVGGKYEALVNVYDLSSGN
jgi:hypothetical protein